MWPPLTEEDSHALNPSRRCSATLTISAQAENNRPSNVPLPSTR